MVAFLIVVGRSLKVANVVTAMKDPPPSDVFATATHINNGSSTQHATSPSLGKSTSLDTPVQRARIDDDSESED
ncbi:hypothetical protein GOP47_0006539 [Adiantum capillus-veneris]|uniref:Uncharacterized protein n=1 Tax=Adiantum capillus-veneris TaxID=13818 RepID=A0A9D4V397_ADICA|nr:hypothetical protein GOP47_0006539 [Adiantum capillus-veneris]